METTKEYSASVGEDTPAITSESKIAVLKQELSEERSKLAGLEHQLMKKLNDVQDLKKRRDLAMSMLEEKKSEFTQLLEHVQLFEEQTKQFEEQLKTIRQSVFQSR